MCRVSMWTSSVAFCLSVILVAVIGGEKEDLFSATVKLETLLKNEKEVVKALDVYVREAQNRIDLIRRYVDTYRAVERDSGRTHSQLVSHPVDAYMLVKRVTVDWGPIEDSLQKEANFSGHVLNQIMNYRHATNYPDQEDLHGAAVALVRLQDTYNLNMSMLHYGKFIGTGDMKQLFSSVQELGSRDCLFLGKHAYNKGYYDKAIDWFEAAQVKAREEGDWGTPEEEIVQFLETAIKTHDDVLEKRGPRGYDWQTNPSPVDKNLAKSRRYLDVVGKAPFIPKLYQVQTEEEETEHMERLCRGEKFRPASLEAALSCRYSHNSHPYLLLNPLKLEEQSLDPYIVVFHDVLSERDMLQLKSAAEPKLFRSRHMDEANNDQHKISSSRISQKY